MRVVSPSINYNRAIPMSYLVDLRLLQREEGAGKMCMARRLLEAVRACVLWYTYSRRERNFPFLYPWLCSDDGFKVEEEKQMEGRALIFFICQLLGAN